MLPPTYGKGLAGIILVAGLLVPIIRSDSPEARGTKFGHTRISAHRNDDGTLKRGPRNEVETSNWSGYAAANFSNGELYTAAQASWRVPTVFYERPPAVCHTVNRRGRTEEICTSAFAEAEYSASWVGIGGYCENAACTTVDNTLIQLGTEQDVAANGASQYYAWIEMLPNYPIVVSPRYPYCDSLSCAYRVVPGDAITASLSCETNCNHPGETQSWQLTMRNATQRWIFSTTVSYASTLLSAEWIEEAPASSAGVLPLADFVNATFSPTVNVMASPNLNDSDAILMVDPYGEISSPSAPEAGPNVDAFTTCWGNNSSNTATCPAP